jgi:hypothetical protein
MARYYFDLDDEQGLMRDNVGVDLPRRGDIPGEVARILGDIMRDENTGGFRASIAVNVRDEADHPVYTGRVFFFGEWQ